MVRNINPLNNNHMNELTMEERAKVLNSLGYEENLYTPSCIRTVSGRYVNVFEPKPEMFCIEDIAHALSMMPRFGGHLPFWYSVADHSVYSCGQASEEYKFTALMHDCSEAFLMDIPKPIKSGIAGYEQIEDNLMKFLANLFGFIYPLPEEVKAIDKNMLEWEWDNLMLKSKKADWGPRSKEMFLEQFQRYNPLPSRNSS